MKKYRPVEETCVGCGRTFERTTRRRKRQCDTCAVARVVDTVRQLQAREGPDYEKWVDRQAAGFQRYLNEIENRER